MLFSPYPDESERIDLIRKFQGTDYALLRLTFTMIDKNNIDANGIFRDMLFNYKIVDYEKLGHGGDLGFKVPALFIQAGKVEEVNLKFYRVNNARGDRRFSIGHIRRRMHQYEINVGDLLYFSVFRTPSGYAQIYFINLTHNYPSEAEIFNAIGVDAITSLFFKIRPRLQEIIFGGWFNNSKGYGPIDPKDVGDTLEALLGIDTNNRTNADYDGLIEVKSKGGGRTLDTLFTLRPRFDGTRVAAYEPIDRNRVSAFARIYGYDSDAHLGYHSLYITIGSIEAPQNNQGFFLHVDDEKRMVDLIRKDPISNRYEITAFWTFKDLKTQLLLKHPSTIWVQAESRMFGDMGQFKYNEIEFSKAPQFATFLTLIKEGIITYDWRGYTTIEGKYAGKNHGNAWRIKPYAKNRLFGQIETINF